MLSMVEDATNNSLDRAEVRVTTACKTDDLSPNSIFLCGKREGSKPGLPKLFNRGGCQVKSGRPNEELDILEAERILVVVRVFAGA